MANGSIKLLLVFPHAVHEVSSGMITAVTTFIVAVFLVKLAMNPVRTIFDKMVSKFVLQSKCGETKTLFRNHYLLIM